MLMPGQAAALEAAIPCSTLCRLRPPFGVFARFDVTEEGLAALRRGRL